MFGKQQMQVVSLKDLTEFVQGMFPAVQQPAQPQYIPQTQQPSNTTTVTIYIQELHIHQPGSGQVGTRLLGAGQQVAALPAPQEQQTVTLSENWQDDNEKVGIPALRCARCGNGIANGRSERHLEHYYHARCWREMVAANHDLIGR